MAPSAAAAADAMASADPGPSNPQRKKSAAERRAEKAAKEREKQQEHKKLLREYGDLEKKIISKACRGSEICFIAVFPWLCASDARLNVNNR